MNQNPPSISQRMNRVSGSTRVSGSAATHGATTSAPATGDAATTVQVAGVPIGWTMYLLGRSLGMIHLLLKDDGFWRFEAT
ncbi:hypothetical protein BDA96_05G150600 [Sorghum bicolor]|uniref:Uncharacterized protein n=2 Tax=Sorghum bicolor TaxID=4558 RepID=A0A921R007_SORBI|nr:hypothetical protein BDA96_05G150600 [Sorghum bicolor]KXG28553.1 hypothetical protein SORBI_3005G136100 [Sorghum bicolor]